MTSIIKTKTKIDQSQSRPWLFLGLTLGLTWVLEFVAAGFQNIIPDRLVTGLRYLAGALPLIISLMLLFIIHDRAYRQDFWHRIIDIKRIKPIWWFVALMFIPLRSGMAALIDIALGGWGIAPEEITLLLAKPLSIIPTLLFWLIFGPLPEEPGWRGYALDGLQVRHSALFSSLAVGFIWSLWHLPLFFIQGTWQSEVVGLGTQWFWLLMLSMVFESVIYTWIVNNTNRSILIVILYHFMTNSFGQLLALSPRAEVFNFILLIVATIVILLIWGPQTLRRPERSS